MKTFHQLAITETLETLQKEGTNLLDNPFRLGSAMYFEVINEAKKLVAEQRYRLTEVDRQVIETNLGEFDVHEGNYVPLDCPMMVEEEEKGKEPPIGKPKAGGPKKFYVYVKDGDKVKKVTFGDTSGLSVKFKDPSARSSYVARHNCDTANDKTTPGYWSCRLPRYASQLGLSGGGSFFWQTKYQCRRFIMKKLYHTYAMDERYAEVFKSDLGFEVDLYENDTLLETREVHDKSEGYAEDVAENWVDGMFDIEPKEGSFYGYNEKNDNYYPGLDD